MFDETTKVGIPYLRAKAQDYFEALGGGDNSGVVEEGLDARQIQALNDRVRFYTTYPYSSS